MTPSLLHVEVDVAREVLVHEVDFLGIVEDLQKARCDNVSVEGETSIFPKEIIVAEEEDGRLNANEATLIASDDEPVHIGNLVTEFLQCKHQSLDNLLVICLENE